MKEIVNSLTPVLQSARWSNGGPPTANLMLKNSTMSLSSSSLMPARTWNGTGKHWQIGISMYPFFFFYRPAFIFMQPCFWNFKGKQFERSCSNKPCLWQAGGCMSGVYSTAQGRTSQNRGHHCCRRAHIWGINKHWWCSFIIAVAPFSSLTYYAECHCWFSHVWSLTLLALLSHFSWSLGFSLSLCSLALSRTHFALLCSGWPLLCSSLMLYLALPAHCSFAFGCIIWILLPALALIRWVLYFLVVGLSLHQVEQNHVHFCLYCRSHICTHTCYIVY